MDIFSISFFLASIVFSALVLIVRTVYVLRKRGRVASLGRSKPLKVMVVAGSGKIKTPRHNFYILSSKLCTHFPTQSLLQWWMRKSVQPLARQMS